MLLNSVPDAHPLPAPPHYFHDTASLCSFVGTEAHGLQWLSGSLCEAAPAAWSQQGTQQPRGLHLRSESESPPHPMTGKAFTVGKEAKKTPWSPAAAKGQDGGKHTHADKYLRWSSAGVIHWLPQCWSGPALQLVPTSVHLKWVSGVGALNFMFLGQCTHYTWL